MINLLPPETKQAYYYARSNQRLIKWVVFLVIGLIGLGAIGTYGWIGIHQSVKTTTSKVSSVQNILAKDNLIGTDAQVQKISTDFSLVVKVLSQEVLFSKLLTKMAAAMPNGANLTSLNINDTSGGSGLDISAEATDYTTATQVEVNLADPSNGIFSNADIVSLGCTSKGSSTNTPQNFNSNYPCTVQIRAQFAKNNQFLFINQGKKA